MESIHANNIPVGVNGFFKATCRGSVKKKDEDGSKTRFEFVRKMPCFDLRFILRV